MKNILKFFKKDKNPKSSIYSYKDLLNEIKNSFKKNIFNINIKKVFFNDRQKAVARSVLKNFLNILVFITLISFVISIFIVASGGGGEFSQLGQNPIYPNTGEPFSISFLSIIMGVVSVVGILISMIIAVLSLLILAPIIVFLSVVADILLYLPKLSVMFNSTNALVVGNFLNNMWLISIVIIVIGAIYTIIQKAWSAPQQDNQGPVFVLLKGILLTIISWFAPRILMFIIATISTITVLITPIFIPGNNCDGKTITSICANTESKTITSQMKESVNKDYSDIKEDSPNSLYFLGQLGLKDSGIFKSTILPLIGIDPGNVVYAVNVNDGGEFISSSLAKSPLFTQVKSLSESISYDMYNKDQSGEDGDGLISRSFRSLGDALFSFINIFISYLGFIIGIVAYSLLMTFITVGIFDIVWDLTRRLLRIIIYVIFSPLYVGLMMISGSGYGSDNITQLFGDINRRITTTIISDLFYTPIVIGLMGGFVLLSNIIDTALYSAGIDKVGTFTFLQNGGIAINLMILFLIKSGILLAVVNAIKNIGGYFGRQQEPNLLNDLSQAQYALRETKGMVTTIAAPFDPISNTKIIKEQVGQGAMMAKGGGANIAGVLPERGSMEESKQKQYQQTNRPSLTSLNYNPSESFVPRENRDVPQADKPQPENNTQQVSAVQPPQTKIKATPLPESKQDY